MMVALKLSSLQLVRNLPGSVSLPVFVRLGVVPTLEKTSRDGALQRMTRHF